MLAYIKRHKFLTALTVAIAGLALHITFGRPRDLIDVLILEDRYEPELVKGMTIEDFIVWCSNNNFTMPYLSQGGLAEGRSMVTYCYERTLRTRSGGYFAIQCSFWSGKLVKFCVVHNSHKYDDPEGEYFDENRYLDKIIEQKRLREAERSFWRKPSQ